MKKTSILLTAILGFGLLFTSCGNNKSSNSKTDVSSNTPKNESLNTKTETVKPVKNNVCHGHHNSYKFTYSASSYLVETINSETTEYSPANLSSAGDTPWVPENTLGANGIGATLTLYGEWDPHLNLLLTNGYQSTKWEDIYNKNSRVKSLKVTVRESGLSREFSIKDTKAPQCLEIKSLVPYEDCDNIHIDLEILDVYPGKKYKDLCLDSVVPFFGNPLDFSDPIDFSTVYAELFKGSQNSREKAQKKYIGSTMKFSGEVMGVDEKGVVELFGEGWGSNTVTFSSSSDISKVKDIDTSEYYNKRQRIEFIGTISSTSKDFWDTDVVNFTNCRLISVGQPVKDITTQDVLNLLEFALMSDLLF